MRREREWLRRLFFAGLLEEPLKFPTRLSRRWFAPDRGAWTRRPKAIQRIFTPGLVSTRSATARCGLLSRRRGASTSSAAISDLAWLTASERLYASCGQRPPSMSRSDAGIAGFADGLARRFGNQQVALACASASFWSSCRRADLIFHLGFLVVTCWAKLSPYRVASTRAMPRGRGRPVSCRRQVQPCASIPLLSLSFSVFLSRAGAIGDGDRHWVLTCNHWFCMSRMTCLIIFSGSSALSVRSLRLARTNVDTRSSNAMVDSF